MDLSSLGVLAVVVIVVKEFVGLIKAIIDRTQGKNGNGYMKREDFHDWQKLILDLERRLSWLEGRSNGRKDHT